MAEPMSDERLAEIRERAERCKFVPDHPGSMFTWQDSAKDVPALLAEVGQLRAELRTWRDAANSSDLDGDVRDHLHGLREWDDTGDGGAPLWLVESVVDLLAPIATERDRLRALVEEALHLRMHGERAPGGTETWPEWDRKAETALRGEEADRG